MSTGKPESRLGADYVDAIRELIASMGSEERFKKSPAYLHWPYIGSRYFTASRRVLYVGRAAYQGHWSQELPTDIHDPAKVFDFLGGRIADREPSDSLPGGCEKFFTQDPAGRAILKNRYFWKLLRVACASLGVTASENEDPFSSIAWSNLFKIAPLGAANPPKWMRALELAEGRAGSLLQKEINALDPHVVIFVTGHTWMYEFWDEGSSSCLTGVAWIPDADKWWEQPIHRVGHQSRRSGQPRLLVATARPELRTRNVALARQVAPALKELLQGWVLEQARDAGTMSAGQGAPP